MAQTGRRASAGLVGPPGWGCWDPRRFHRAMKPGSAAARPGASPRSHCCRRFQANPGRKRVGQSDSNSDCETVPTTANPHREGPVQFQLTLTLGVRLLLAAEKAKACRKRSRDERKRTFSPTGPRYRNTNRFCNDKSLLQASAANLARRGQTSVLLGHSLPVSSSDIATIILRSITIALCDGHKIAPCPCYRTPCGSRHPHWCF